MLALIFIALLCLDHFFNKKEKDQSNAGILLKKCFVFPREKTRKIR